MTEEPFLHGPVLKFLSPGWPTRLEWTPAVVCGECRPLGRLSEAARRSRDIK